MFQKAAALNLRAVNTVGQEYAINRGMEAKTAYYITKLKEDLSQRQRVNPMYSLRAYATFLDMHSSTLSQVLKGKRALPFKNAPTVANKLRLKPRERTLFLESLYQEKTSLDRIKVNVEDDDRFMLDESYSKVIAEWEHYALLTILDLDNFHPTLVNIAERLGITQNRAEVVLSNLMTCDLILINEDGTLKKTHARVRTTEDVTSTAIREGHLEALEMGKNKLEEIEVELRDFSAMTIALDLEKLPEAKTIIREFRQKMGTLLRNGNKTEVYQLAIQFYPLTQIKIQ